LAFRFLPLESLVPPGEVPADLDLVVAVDVGSLERLGSLAGVSKRAGGLVVIDHHRSNEGFGDVAWIDPDAAASAQLATDLLDELEWPLTPEIATCLYTGIVTDTGRFQYSSTSPAVHRLAARLIEAGAVPDDVGRHVYEESPFGYLTLAGTVLSRARLDADLGLVWSTVYLADLEAAGIGYEDADGLINEIRVASGSEVACLLKETGGGTKASLRSRGVVDVGAVARHLGGGGHRNSAGFTRSESPERVIELVQEALRD
jgi:phosphoesterase RecJ-like protein